MFKRCEMQVRDSLNQLVDGAPSRDAFLGQYYVDNDMWGNCLGNQAKNVDQIQSYTCYI